MKNLFLFLIIVLAGFSNASAQNLITLQSSGVSTFYLKLPDAVTNAQDEDTIYIPGGSFDDITIAKTLHLIGVGHDPDSTKATLITFLPSVTFRTGSNGSTLTGIRTNVLSVGSSDDEIKNVIISRCCILSCDIGTKCSNISFVQNIISSVYGNGIAHDISFNNNKIQSLGSFEYCSFRNNIILSIFYYNSVVSISVFENNYLGVPGYVHNSILYNNISYNGFNIESDNAGANNLFNQATGSIFVKDDSSFDYANDYHLIPDCPGKNAGRDGTDIGIYGGAFPWKEGSIPANPHFQSIKINPATDTNGNLNVKIKVAAQDN